jgi:hypothetical protein
LLSGTAPNEKNLRIGSPKKIQDKTQENAHLFFDDG